MTKFISNFFKYPEPNTLKQLTYNCKYFYFIVGTCTQNVNQRLRNIPSDTQHQLFIPGNCYKGHSKTKSVLTILPKYYSTQLQPIILASCQTLMNKQFLLSTWMVGSIKSASPAKTNTSINPPINFQQAYSNA